MAIHSTIASALRNDEFDIPLPYGTTSSISTSSCRWISSPVPPRGRDWTFCLRQCGVSQDLATSA
jgi:hypothetical protein